MSIHERKVSCNYHGEETGNKTVMVVIYILLGLIGLSVLLYEIYSIIAQIVKAF